MGTNKLTGDGEGCKLREPLEQSVVWLFEILDGVNKLVESGVG